MTRIKTFLNTCYLLYLGIIPAAATFFMMQQNGNLGWLGLPLLLVGIVLVAVYLAMVISYTKPVNNVFLLLFIMLNGPLLGLLSKISTLDFSQILINTFFIENAAIWIAIGILAVTSGRPTKNQLIGSVILAFLSMLSLGIFGYTYGLFEQSPFTLTIIGFGIIETLLIKYHLLYKDAVVRETDKTTLYIVGFIFLWIIAMILGINSANS